MAKKMAMAIPASVKPRMYTEVRGTLSRKLAEHDLAHLDGRLDVREIACFFFEFFVLRPEGGLK